MAALLEPNVKAENHPEPDEPVDPPTASYDLNIDTISPCEAQVKKAIKARKSGKAPTIDSNLAEILIARPHSVQVTI